MGRRTCNWGDWASYDLQKKYEDIANKMGVRYMGTTEERKVYVELPTHLTLSMSEKSYRQKILINNNYMKFDSYIENWLAECLLCIQNSFDNSVYWIREISIKGIDCYYNWGKGIKNILTIEEQSILNEVYNCIFDFIVFRKDDSHFVPKLISLNGTGHYSKHDEYLKKFQELQIDKKLGFEYICIDTKDIEQTIRNLYPYGFPDNAYFFKPFLMQMNLLNMNIFKTQAFYDGFEHVKQNIFAKKAISDCVVDSYRKTGYNRPTYTYDTSYLDEEVKSRIAIIQNISKNVIDLLTVSL